MLYLPEHNRGQSLNSEGQLSNIFVNGPGGQTLEYRTWFDSDPDLPLSNTIAEIRQTRYKAEGLLTSEARAADELRGPNVEFEALINALTGEPVASLRKIHTISDLSDLPSYRKFIEAGSFTKDGRDLLGNIAAQQSIVEIAALWKSPAYPSQTKIDLYRLALQRSVEYGEAWMMGVVQPEYRSLCLGYGSAVHTLGTPAAVKGEGASEHVRLTPVLVNPLTFFDEIITDINEAKIKGEEPVAETRDAVLWQFLRGLDWRRLLSETTVSKILGRLAHV